MYPSNGAMVGGRLELGHKALAGSPERGYGLHGSAHSLLGLFPPCLQGGAKSASEGPGPHPQVSQVGLLWCTTHTHLQVIQKLVPVSKYVN